MRTVAALRLTSSCSRGARKVILETRILMTCIMTPVVRVVAESVGDTVRKAKDIRGAGGHQPQWNVADASDFSKNRPARNTPISNFE